MSLGKARGGLFPCTVGLGHDCCDCSRPHIYGGVMAEIRVAPQRRSRAIVWIILLIVVLAVLAWYFLAGPGAVASTTVEV